MKDYIVPAGLGDRDRNYAESAEFFNISLKLPQYFCYRRVDGAIFVVSLEDYRGAQASDVQGGDLSQVENLVKNILIGNGRNNWFDKSINMIFLKDGTFALQFEHSWGDGISVVRFMNEVCKDSFENPVLPYSATTDDFLPITRSPRLDV